MMSAFRFHRVRLTIGEIMMAVAAFAVACAWPVLLLPTVAGVLSLLLHRFGFTLIESIVIVAVLGVLLGLCIPPVESDCGGGGTAPIVPPPNISLQRTGFAGR